MISSGAENYDDVPSGADVRVTQKRRAEKLAQRRRRNQRNALGFSLILIASALLIRGRAPKTPQLRVSWPNAQKLGAATLQNGATIVIRGGQPFAVTPVDAVNWDVSWHYTGARGEGLPITWPPSGNLDTLEMRCRPRAAGWNHLVSWLWPTRKVVLYGTSAVELRTANLDSKRFIVMAQSGAPIRLSSRVVASRNVASEAIWDERALPLLEEAARKTTALTAGATWTIAAPSSSKSSTRNAAEAKENAGKTDGIKPVDTATYAILAPTAFRDPVAAMTQCAQVIAARAPQANIKWIAREKVFGKEPRAILWIDFSPPKPLTRRERRRRRRLKITTPPIGVRAGWVVRAGDTNATPVDWWSAKTPAISPQ